MGGGTFAKPLRAFFKRIATLRGKHVAAVATARKLVMIMRHMLTKGTDYVWMRPALLARKFRTIELRVGLPTSMQRGAQPTTTIFLRSGRRNGPALKRPSRIMQDSPRGGVQSRGKKKAARSA